MKGIAMLNWTARLFATALVIGLVGSTAMAAKGPNEPNKPARRAPAQGRDAKSRVEARLDAMTKSLDLTAEQREKVKPILEEQMKQMEAVRADQSMSAEQKRAKSQEIRKEYNDKIEQVLTPEQKEKFKKMQQEQRSRRPRQAPSSAGEGKAPDNNSKQ
jgi:Spy/CpxP family protein refolding chaperone